MILVALTRQVWSYDDSDHLWLWLESPLVTWTCASTSPNKLLFCLRSAIAKLPAPLLSDEITIFVCREVFSRCVSTAKFRSFFSVNANDRRRISRKVLGRPEILLPKFSPLVVRQSSANWLNDQWHEQKTNCTDETLYRLLHWNCFVTPDLNALAYSGFCTSPLWSSFLQEVFVPKPGLLGVFKCPLA